MFIVRFEIEPPLTVAEPDNNTVAVPPPTCKALATDVLVPLHSNCSVVVVFITLVVLSVTVLLIIQLLPPAIVTVTPPETV